MSATQAISVHDAIQKCPFEKELMDMAMGAVDQALNVSMSKPAAASASALSFKGQQLTTPQNYFPQFKIAKLSNPSTSLHEANDIIVGQYKDLGVLFASEATKKWAMAFSLHFETLRTNVFPAYARIYKDGQDFAASLGGASHHAASPGLSSYPEKPTELPKSMYDKAYSSENPPVEIIAPRLAVLANKHVPSRKTSNLLKLEAGSQAARGTSQALALRQDPQADLLNKFKNFLMDALGDNDGSGSRGHGGIPGLRIFQQKPLATGPRKRPLRST